MIFFAKKQGSIFKASAILAVFSFMASLVAVFRDRILTSHFGASRTIDIYYSAFKIPDLIFNLLVLGAVSSAFIPVFIESYSKDPQSAWRTAQNFLNTIFVSVALICGLGVIFVRPLMWLIAPGFSGPERELAIQLTRLMFLSPIIFSVSTIIGSILQSLEKFLAYAVAPIFYNAGIIIGALYFAPFFKSRGQTELFGLGLGVILGAVMHLLTQLPSALRAGFRFRAVFDFADEKFRKILKLMIPRTLGLGAYSIDSMVTNAIASLLGAGSIAVFNFANNFQFVPISVVGISTAIAVFPRLSFQAADGQYANFRDKLYSAMKNTVAIVLPAAVLLFVFRKLIIKTILGAGLFKGASVDITASVLGIFMFGVIAQSLIPILSRAYYAMQNTKTPVAVSIFSIAVNITLGLIFSFVLHLGVRGLAVAFSIAGNVNFFLLFFLFHRKYLSGI